VTRYPPYFKDAIVSMRELMEMHPYECFCGAGLTTANDCVYCQTYERTAELLEKCGFPLSFRRGKMETKETQNGKPVETVGNDDDDESTAAGKDGAVGSLPNCS